jgi:hypothetical protein
MNIQLRADCGHIYAPTLDSRTFRMNPVKRDIALIFSQIIRFLAKEKSGKPCPSVRTGNMLSIGNWGSIHGCTAECGGFVFEGKRRSVG